MTTIDMMIDEYEATAETLREVSWRVSHVSGQLEPDGCRPDADDMDECVEDLEEAIEEAMQTDVDDLVPQLEEAVEMLKLRAYDWDDMSEILSGVIEQVSYEIDRCEYRASTLENTGRLPEYDAYIADQMYDAHRDRLILGMEY